MTEVQQHRPTSLIGTIGAQQTWLWPADQDDSPWMAYRASLARVWERPGCLTCRQCGCILDEPAPAHSPRCGA